MITCMILAGGVGSRMNLGYPKQFVMIDGKPLIIHTIENFLNNKQIERYLIVCEPNWIGKLNEILFNYGLDDVMVVPGGKTSHESIRNGIFYLESVLEESDFLIIHDAARPIVPDDILDDLIETAKKYGNACSSLPFYEPVMKTDNGKYGTVCISRDELVRTGAPQMFNYGLILSVYKKAESDNKHDFVYASVVASYYGEKIYFSKGSTINIKITNPEDMVLFKSIKANL